MNPPARQCPRCHKPVVAGVLCPDCGLLEAAHDPPVVPLPEECPLSKAERGRWRAWFWVLLVLGPASGLLTIPLGAVLSQGVPSLLRPFFNTGGPFMALGLPVVAALGAAFCLARSQTAQRTTSELIGFTLLMALLFLFTQAAIVFVGWSVLVRVLQ